MTISKILVYIGSLIAIATGLVQLYSFFRNDKSKALPSSLGSGPKSGVRSFRNNNPLNIIYVESNAWEGKVPPEQRTDDTFEEFVSPLYGARAGVKLMVNKVNSGYDTLHKLITNWTYGDPIESQFRYIQFVSQNTGIQETETISTDKKTIALIAHEMSTFEGYTFPLDLFEQAYEII